MTAASSTDDEVPPPPSFAEAVAVWLRIGLLSFGGPAGQIALMHRILIDEKRWISETRFLHALNYCMLLPGPEAQQLATYIGWLLHGTRGGIVAGTLFVLPGFLVILALSTAYALLQDASWFASVFFGLKAAVLAVVIEALLRVAGRALKNRTAYVLAAAAFIGIFFLQLPFPLIVLGAGLIGYLGARFRPDLFVASGGHSAKGGRNDGVVDRLQRSVEPSAGRALAVIGIWGGLWLAPIILLAALFGWNSVYMPIAKFFSEMAVVTFGGAYAVLAYVAQQAVQTLGWLRPGEMLDGLALAETTPGPLILVLTYVGFLAAFRAPGDLPPLAAALIGASLTTWVTFVPCFLWIFLGAPYVERLRGNAALSAALSAITAAVVGVILNLSIWFGLHVLFRRVDQIDVGPLHFAWPQLSSIDSWAVILSLLAMLCLFRLRIGMIATLAICAVCGVAIRVALP